jgi:small-conductance mechanosensitive channel
MSGAGGPIISVPRGPSPAGKPSSAMSWTDLTSRIESFIPHVLAALPVVLVILVGAFLMNLMVGRILLMIAGRTRLTELDVLPIRNVLSWLIRLLAVILIASAFGFQIGGIWAMISTLFGLVAIGFVAVWSLLSHTSATMFILFLRPFEMGDDLEFAGEPVRGRVVDINFFFTTLIDHEGNLQQIPNNLFFQKTLKRRKNLHVISLAAQLNSPHPVEVELPPAFVVKPGEDKVKAPDPMMNFPDPKSFMPPGKK